MADGFEAYADDGSLLLNSNMIAWFCARTGRGVTEARNGVGNTTISKAVIPTSGSDWGLTYPLSAIRVDGDHAAARATNAWNSGYHQYATSAPIGTGFTWYVFDYAPRLPAINYGVECYRDDGQRSFSSAYFPFKPIADVRAGARYTPGKYLAISGPSMGVYARPQNGQITYYDSPNGEPLPEGDNTGWTHYSYQNDSKLYGGRVVGPDYAEPFDVSYDDVFFNRQPAPLIVALWDIQVPVLAVDVSNIPTPAVLF